MPMLLGLLLAACSATPESGATPAPAASDQLSMTRGPCFGACPMYAVTVYGDGRVEFVGDRFVEKTGSHSAVADPVRVAELFAYAESIGFFDMPQNITPANEPACGMSHTDDSSAEITLVWGDRDRTVSHYHGCSKAPEALRSLERRIDEVAGTARWIGQP